MNIRPRHWAAGAGIILIIGAVAPGTLQDRFGGPGVPSFAPPGPSAGMTGQRFDGATVVRVVDGDTIRVRLAGFETPVRLLGIDTPERGECWSREATTTLRRLTPPGATVTVETDRTQRDRDRYGRLLAYVYAQGDNGADATVNRRLLAAGAGDLYQPAGPVWFAGELTAARDQARAKRLGRWGTC